MSSCSQNQVMHESISELQRKVSPVNATIFTLLQIYSPKKSRVTRFIIFYIVHIYRAWILFLGLEAIGTNCDILSTLTRWNHFISDGEGRKDRYVSARLGWSEIMIFHADACQAFMIKYVHNMCRRQFGSTSFLKSVLSQLIGNVKVFRVSVIVLMWESDQLSYFLKKNFFIWWQDKALQEQNNLLAKKVMFDDLCSDIITTVL